MADEPAPDPAPEPEPQPAPQGAPEGGPPPADAPPDAPPAALPQAKHVPDYFPIIVTTCCFGALFIILPLLVRKGPHRGPLMGIALKTNLHHASRNRQHLASAVAPGRINAKQSKPDTAQ
ncbi:unnamed protein product, partial [Iphiclides podalirius]